MILLEHLYGPLDGRWLLYPPETKSVGDYVRYGNLLIYIYPVPFGRIW